MSENEDQKEINNNFNNKDFKNFKQEKEEKIKKNEREKMNMNNEHLINEFNEYFRNNNIQKENIINSFNINNNSNSNKEFNNNGIELFPFILDKEQFYQSFVLFQKYIYWNMQKNYMEKINQENLNNKNINDKQNNINNIDSYKIHSPVKDNTQEFNNIKTKTSDEEIQENIKIPNNKTFSSSKAIKKNSYSLNGLKEENKMINKESNYNNVLYESKYSSSSNSKKFENYDEKPIKTHKNFLELLEKSLNNKNLEIFHQIYKGKIKLRNTNPRTTTRCRSASHTA